MRIRKRLGTVAACIGLAAIGVAALPGHAQAWWAWRGGVRIWIPVPGVVVAPPPVYVPPPTYYYAPPPIVYAPPPGYYVHRRIWVRPHWNGRYWVPGHWA